MDRYLLFDIFEWAMRLVEWIYFAITIALRLIEVLVIGIILAPVVLFLRFLRAVCV